MSKEVIEQVAAVARQLEEHLKFYREMGVADIGGSSRAAEQALEAGFEAESVHKDEPAPAQSAELRSLTPEPEIIEQRVEAMPKKTEPTGQESLFGGLFPELQQEAKG